MKCYVLWLWTKLHTDKQSFQGTERTKASKTERLVQFALSGRLVLNLVPNKDKRIVEKKKYRTFLKAFFYNLSHTCALHFDVQRKIPFPSVGNNMAVSI